MAQELWILRSIAIQMRFRDFFRGAVRNRTRLGQIQQASDLWSPTGMDATKRETAKKALRDAERLAVQAMRAEQRNTSERRLNCGAIFGAHNSRRVKISHGEHR